MRLNSDPSTDHEYSKTPASKNIGVFDYTSEVAESAIKMINLFDADLKNNDITSPLKVAMNQLSKNAP